MVQDAVPGMIGGRIGRLSRITDSEGTVDFAYDETGRLSSETRVIGSATHVTGYSYNAFGDLAGMTYPSGMQVSCRVAAGDGLILL